MPGCNVHGAALQASASVTTETSDDVETDRCEEAMQHVTLGQHNKMRVAAAGRRSSHSQGIPNSLVCCPGAVLAAAP